MKSLLHQHMLISSWRSPEPRLLQQFQDRPSAVTKSPQTRLNNRILPFSHATVLGNQAASALESHAWTEASRVLSATPSPWLPTSFQASESLGYGKVEVQGKNVLWLARHSSFFRCPSSQNPLGVWPTRPRARAEVLCGPALRGNTTGATSGFSSGYTETWLYASWLQEYFENHSDFQFLITLGLDMFWKSRFWLYTKVIIYTYSVLWDTPVEFEAGLLKQIN